MSDRIQTPSIYQQKIFDMVPEQWQRLKLRRRDPNTTARPRNVIIQAEAGSGKSTTLRELCRYLPDAKIAVVSFGARDAAQAAPKLPSNATSTTMHALGKQGLEGFFQRAYRTADQIDRNRGDGELAKNKIARIVARLKEDGKIDRYVPAALVGKLVDRAKGIGLVPVDAHVGMRQIYPVDGLQCDDGRDDIWRNLMIQYGIEYANPGRLVAAARDALRVSLESSGAIIDFADMIYIPTILRDLRFGRRDVIMADELQDLDAVQRRMLVKLVSEDGVDGAPRTFHTLFVGVGDPHQAIYAWRGADSESMDRCREELDCVILPLSICYRCPTSHLDAAREYSPAIEARPDAPVGEIIDFRNGAPYHNGYANPMLADQAALAAGDDPAAAVGKVTIRPGMFQPGDAVICRLNAPLVTVAYWLMKARIPCRVIGRDFGKNLIGVIDGVKITNADAAIDKLRERLRRQEKRDADDKTLDGEPSDATAKLRDQIDVLSAIVENLVERAGERIDAEAAASGEPRQYGNGPLVAVHQVIAEIDHLFGDGAGDGSDVVSLLSIHKAKGGEWPRVWWCDEDNCVPRARSQEWAIQETRNLRLVAWTRSMSSLFFFSSEDL